LRRYRPRRYSLFDPKGKAVLKKPLSVSVPVGIHGQWPRLEAHFDQTVQNVLLWSAEIPNLYRLVVTLKDKAGKAVESTSTRIGFRSIEVRNRNLLVNGKRVLIKGVNRHDHDDTKGKALSRETLRLDAVRMKQFSFNAVRTSHYPNDPYWLDLCDEFGLYVIDEAQMFLPAQKPAAHRGFCPVKHRKKCRAPVTAPDTFMYFEIAQRDRVKHHALGRRPHRKPAYLRERRFLSLLCVGKRGSRRPDC